MHTPIFHGTFQSSHCTVNFVLQEMWKLGVEMVIFVCIFFFLVALMGEVFFSSSSFWQQSFFSFFFFTPFFTPQVGEFFFPSLNVRWIFKTFIPPHFKWCTPKWCMNRVMCPQAQKMVHALNYIHDPVIDLNSFCVKIKGQKHNMFFPKN